MRIAAIDYGQARIGIAITDEEKKIAFPLKTIKAGKNIGESAQNIVEALKEYLHKIEKIILGYPLHLNNTSSNMSKIVQSLSLLLQNLLLQKKFNIEIVLYDERLSSAQAEKFLREDLNMNRKKRSSVIDNITATLILQNYLGFDLLE